MLDIIINPPEAIKLECASAWIRFMQMNTYPMMVRYWKNPAGEVRLVGSYFGSQAGSLTSILDEVSSRTH